MNCRDEAIPMSTHNLHFHDTLIHQLINTETHIILFLTICLKQTKAYLATERQSNCKSFVEAWHDSRIENEVLFF